MLSDHERRTLHEVERRLLAEDPEFTRFFDTRARRLRREHRDGGWSTTVIVAAVLLCGLMLVVGSPSGALAFAAMTALIWLAWRRSKDTPAARRDPRPETDHW